MLGRFLEYSVATPDIRASLEFYEKLGFTPAATGDVWPHPYAVVTDGRLTIGLHGDPDAAAVVTFVRPGLLRVADALEALGVRFDTRRLGDDVFNELGWSDPWGQRLRLLEARTFSPAERRATDTSGCGYFREIALPCGDFAEGKRYWEQLGFVGMVEPGDAMPHVACTSDTLDVGLYDPAHVARPLLAFECDDVGGTLARLERAGIAPRERVPAPLRGRPAALLTAPEGTALLLTGPAAA